MADKNIGMLPQVPQLDDESLMVVEQQGTAMKMTGRQFKNFGKIGVLEEVQDYVNDAQQAAQEAVNAVKAVTDMTVSASTLESGEPATVGKTTQGGVYHLAFGLPRGERGEPGPEGKRGPAGPPGTGLKILGYYDTPAALEAAQPNPSPGDAYGIGVEAPYDVYVFDGESGQWKNNGPLTGGGTILPENVVTAEGGSSLEFGEELGEAPHTITFDGEEEPPLTAEDIQYSETETVKEAIEGLFTSVSNGKQTVASAITDMGVPTEQDAAFSVMAENIRQISGGADTSDATATPGDILSGKTAYTAAGKVEGIIPTLPAQTITPGTANRTIAGGQYLGGTQTIQGDTNLVSANIRKGASIFGVAGAMTSEFKATLTVKADTGAVVTAKCGDTEVSALSTNGSVVLELPIEGSWTVTAVRGVAQYNSVVIEVSSHYSAELTATIHIEYFGSAPSLSQARDHLAAVSNGNYALFGGGRVIDNSKPGGFTTVTFDIVEAYDKNLTRTLPAALHWDRMNLAATSIGSYAIFAGGLKHNKYSEGGSGSRADQTTDAYDRNLTKASFYALSQARYNLAGASIGNYALFGGGQNSDGVSSTVDAYSSDLTRTTPTPLQMPRRSLAAASNGTYAIFGGGVGEGSLGHVTAYNASLTRSTPTSLSESRYNLSAVRAGNYVLFCGGSDKNTVDAYDLFLTRTVIDSLSVGRNDMAGTTIGDFALIGGGNTGNGSSYKEFKTVDVFSPYLSHGTTTDLPSAKSALAATSLENYALFGGGYSRPSFSASVNVYQYI